MRTLDGHGMAVALFSSLFSLTLACGSTAGKSDGGGAIDGGGGGAIDGRPCHGLECFQTSCPGGGETSVSGTVYAPNGTLPLHDVNVYVPNGPLSPLPAGATCDRCGTVLSGNPLVRTTTDAMGRFTLEDVPATADVPLVIQVGKWRRQITIPSVTPCEDTALDGEQTRLPRNRSEGDIPLMALTTGGVDALECLLRKIGLDDSEFTTAGGEGRVHLYAGRDGTDQLDTALGGAMFTRATELWSSLDALSAYDVVFLSCEGGQDPANKPASARAAMKAYADLGGRVFASHWHNYWIQHGGPPWSSVATFNFRPDLGNVDADIDTSFPGGDSLATWLVNVGASATRGTIALRDTQHTVTSVDGTLAERWIYKDVTTNGAPSVQYFSFTTPLEEDASKRCGRVVLSDIHVSSGDASAVNLTFPSGGCTTDIADMTPQEKVLAFMIFDIASCIGPIVD